MDSPRVLGEFPCLVFVVEGLGKLGCYLCSLCIHFRFTPWHGDALVSGVSFCRKREQVSHRNKGVCEILLHDPFLID